MTLPGVMPSPLGAPPNALGTPPIPRELRRPPSVEREAPRSPQLESGAMRVQGSAPSSPEPPARPSLLNLGFVEDEQASVLVVGAGHAMQTALTAALTRHGMHVETTPGKAVLDSVVAATPSLILVVGEAAQDAGRAVLAELRSVEHGSSVPVAVLMEEANLDARLRAFGNGAAAVIPQGPSVDALAERVAHIARKLAPSSGALGAPSNAGLGETTLGGVLDAVGRRLAARLLPNADTSSLAFDSVRLSLGEGRRVAEIVEDFTNVLAPCVLNAERVEYQLNATSTTAELLGEAAVAEAQSTGNVAAMRVVLADRNAARADTIAQALRSHGALVVVTALDPSARHLATMSQFDPAVLLIGIEDLYAAQELIGRMHADDRLRWAGILTANWDELGFFEDNARAIDGLLGRLAALAEPERSLSARAELGDKFDMRLEVMGPARTLRALAACSHVVRVKYHNPKATVQVELSSGLVVGARARIHSDSPKELDGVAALATALLLDEGRVEVERIAEAARVNVMSTVDSALDLAAREPAPLERVVRPAPAVQSLIAASADMAALAAPLAAARAPEPAVAAATASSAELEAPTPAKSRDSSRVALVLAAVLAAVVIITIALLVSNRARHEASRAVAATSTAVASTVASAPKPPESVADRARRGDRGAVAELEARGPSARTIEDTIALAQGRIALRKGEIEDLRSNIVARPSLMDDRQTVSRLIEYARDPSVAAEALAAIASLPGTKPSDIIYEVWTGTSDRSSATALAQQFANMPLVREKASAALGVALDLRKATACEEFRALIPAAKDHGDRRSLRPLSLLLRRTGCGSDKTEDCYSCLRADDEALTSAINAVRQRRAPRL